ncbi:serine/threonine protein kinase [Acinetobacter zhairhuonensis]|uniref:serine/threonine protein kinase n=1 Tax=Acinetobacter sp. A7.4 TaxID=2919921 RepID=UPI001F4DD3AC|nr:protein kinase [Acinetobacter sp. A7.4]MCJ8160581.1 protein kinase [Acinetobacter sp. A7.4]
MSKLILPDFKHIEGLTLTTKPNSLRYGRRLYSFQYQKKMYWLKMQLQQGHPSYLKGFQRELAFYQQCLTSELLSKITLPSKSTSKALLSEIGLEVEHEQSLAQILLLPEAMPYFAFSPQSCSVQVIQHHLLHVLDALDALHKAGWLHADLKHEHFVKYDAQLKLIDFEQVQSIGQPVQTEMNATPRYMAPELFHGEVKTIQTDIYALGIIFYEWLAGRQLSAENYTDWAYLHCQRLNVELPDKFLVFKPLLSKMLAKHKAARFDNIYAIKHALVTEIA